MKKLLLVLLTFAAYQANATKFTVNNALNGGAMFTTIQAAIDACADSGDEIYISGSPNTYAAFTVLNKSITFYGPGFSPDKNNPVRALINGATFQNNPVSTSLKTASGSIIQGLVFLTDVFFSTGAVGDKPVNNIRVERCEFRAPINIVRNASNYIFEGNYITGSVARITFGPSSSYTNFLIHNNIFRTDGSSNGHFTDMANVSNILIDHNLFYTNSPGAGGSQIFAGSASKFLVLSNNIFVNMNVGSNLRLSTFNNNLTFYPSIAAPAEPWTIGDNINGGNNKSNVSPQLADIAAVTIGTDNPVLNFTIAAGPANNAGTDGKDIGLLFDETGSLNWNVSRMVRLPYIFSMNISNPTVGPGTSINVEVTAKKNN